MTLRWTTPAGFLGTATELTSTLFSVTATEATFYNVISGTLPDGLGLNYVTGNITGAPVAVLNTTNSKFVIRASNNNNNVIDRSFNIDVAGPDRPNWLTPAGYLYVGVDGEQYAINNQYVNYKLQAAPVESPLNAKLTYFIGNGGGELPPGLTLSSDGVISGFLTDSLVFDGLQSASGGYDDEQYDGYSYDHFADAGNTIVGLPKIYNFRITASDGISNTSTVFKILVVNPTMVRGPAAIPAEWPVNFVGNVTNINVGYNNVLPANLELFNDSGRSKPYYGYIEAFRFTNFPRWTTDFAVPYDTVQYLSTLTNSYGDPYYNNVLVLMSGMTTENLITDPNLTPAITGAITNQTAPTSKLYATSLYNPGTAVEDGITIPNIPALGATDWCIDFFNFTPPGNPLNSVTDDWTIVNWDNFFTIGGTTTGTNYLAGYDYFAQFNIGDSEGKIHFNLTTSTWHHIAATRYGNTGTIFVDGVAVGSTSTIGKSIVVTVPNHGFVSSSSVYGKLLAVQGETEINNVSYYIKTLSTSTLGLYNDVGFTSSADGSTHHPYTGGGTLNTFIVQPNPTYFPPLQFINGADLGTIRANNNQDIDVSVYDPYPNNGKVVYTITTTTDLLTQLPPDLELDSTKGLLFGLVPYQPAYTKHYDLTICATRYVSTATTSSVYTTATTFKLAVKGEVESTIEWVTDNNLGTIETGLVSELFVLARQLTSDYSIKYNQTSGTIPPGLTLERDGTFSGSVTHGSTGTYTFGIEASDVYGLSAISRQFTVNIAQTDSTEYTKIYVRPFLSEQKRSAYQEFITNDFTFDPSLMYRYYDSNFGIQNQIKMVLEFGIEQTNLADYTYALRENFYRKRLYFGNVKVAVARDSTGTAIYEVVYVDVVDDQVNSAGQSASSVLYNKDKIYYSASVNNMRKQLESISLPDNSYIGVNQDYLPKFMQTAQDGGYQLAGYMKVIPLCYALPGNGAKIVSRIKISGFDFKMLDFEIDRLIVESSLDSASAKYLIFERQTIGEQIPEDELLYGPDEVLVTLGNN